MYNAEDIQYMIEKYTVYFYHRVFYIKNITFERRHTLIRKNPTFRSADIVRFWCIYLDKQEQWEVFVFFVLFVPAVALGNAHARGRKLAVISQRAINRAAPTRVDEA